MHGRISLILGALASLASASPCGAPPPAATQTATATATATATLPVDGTSSLAAPPTGATLLHIALGHGIQNYTCTSSNSSAATSVGALAVLYDVTSLYPGTSDTSLSASDWSSLTSTVLWSQSLPLNLQDPSAASPGTREDPNVLPETDYAAVVSDPFPSPAGDLTIAGVSSAASYLGHHYFDSAGIATFNLDDGELFAHMSSKDSYDAPSSADPGILDTGAVAWLRLVPGDDGYARGLSAVYRVVTAGGNAEACSESGAGDVSVPYAAFYWFYG